MFPPQARLSFLRSLKEPSLLEHRAGPFWGVAGGLITTQSPQQGLGGSCLGGSSVGNKAQLQPFVRARLAHQGLSYPKSRRCWDSPSSFHHGSREEMVGAAGSPGADG